MENKELIRKPKFCCIVITDNCFMRCKMCSLWKGVPIQGEKMPSVGEWKNFLSSLYDFVQGPIEVNISGGEPFMVHEKLLELIKFSNKLGFLTSVTSNGFLIDKRMAVLVKESGLKRIILSLDSLQESVHDELRGRKGSLKKVMDAIGYLSEEYPELEMGVQSIIMEKNLNDIIPLVHWARENNALRFIHFQAAIQPIGDPPKEKGWYLDDIYDGLWPKNFEKVSGVLDQLISLREIAENNPYKIANPASQFRAYKTYFKEPDAFIRRERKCNTTDAAINVNKFGLVFLCMFVDPIGHIKDPVTAVWHSPKALKARQMIESCKRNCNFLVNCNFED